MRFLTGLLFGLCLLSITSISVDAAAANKKVRSPSSYTSCNECVRAGFGWSLTTHRCSQNEKNKICNNNNNQNDNEEDEDNEDNDDDNNHVDQQRNQDIQHRRRVAAEKRKVSFDDDDDEDNVDNYDDDDDDDDNDDDNDDDDDDDDNDNDTPRQRRTPSKQPKVQSSYPYENTVQTTQLWSLIHSGDYAGLDEYLQTNPDLVHHRSEDGRGALWWAYEYEKPEMIELLLQWGAEEDAVDINGQRPSDMAPDS